MYDLSDINPFEFHMMIPRSFRRSSDIPGPLVLYKGNLDELEIENRDGYSLTTLLRTVLDVSREESISRDFVAQAITEALDRGLITEGEQKTAMASSTFPQWAKEMFK